MQTTYHPEVSWFVRFSIIALNRTSSLKQPKYPVNILPISPIPQGKKRVEHTIALISQRQREKLQKQNDFSRLPTVPLC